MNIKRTLKVTVIPFCLLAIAIFFIMYDKPLYYPLAMIVVLSFYLLSILFLLRKMLNTTVIIFLNITIVVLTFFYCREYKISRVLILVPNNYEGYVALGFLANSKSPTIRNNTIIIDLTYKQSDIFSKSFTKYFRNTPLFVSEQQPIRDINSLDEADSKRTFINSFDTVKIGSNVKYIYKLFISRLGYKENDTTLKKVIKNYEHQIENIEREFKQK